MRVWLSDGRQSRSTKTKNENTTGDNIPGLDDDQDDDDKSSEFLPGTVKT